MGQLRAAARLDLTQETELLLAKTTPGRAVGQRKAELAAALADALGVAGLAASPGTTRATADGSISDVTVRDNATYEYPTRSATGFEAVFVNGVQVRRANGRGAGRFGKRLRPSFELFLNKASQLFGR